MELVLNYNARTIVEKKDDEELQFTLWSYLLRTLLELMLEFPRGSLGEKLTKLLVLLQVDLFLALWRYVL